MKGICVIFRADEKFLQEPTANFLHQCTQAYLSNEPQHTTLDNTLSETSLRLPLPPAPPPPSPIDAVHRILRGRAARLIIGSLKNPASGLIHGTNAFYYKGGRTISLEENNWNWMPDLRAWEELARRFSRVVII